MNTQQHNVVKITKSFIHFNQLKKKFKDTEILNIEILLLSKSYVLDNFESIGMCRYIVCSIHFIHLLWSVASETSTEWIRD